MVSANTESGDGFVTLLGACLCEAAKKAGGWVQKKLGGLWGWLKKKCGPKKGGNAIHVTPDGVALPNGPKHKIPDGYVENPHRSGSYGVIEDGKLKEKLRIDPGTPPGQKGPQHSHYHLDGGKEHYSPRPGDHAPGFGGDR